MRRACALGLLVLLAACSADRQAPVSSDRSVLLASAQSSSFSLGYDRLVDGLPNATAPAGGSAHDLVVLGTIRSATSERGYVETGTGPTAGRPGARVVRFDDPAAHWRTLRVTVDVESVISGDPRTTLELSWPVMGSAAEGQDAAAVERALQDLGRVALLTWEYPEGTEFLGIDRGVRYPGTDVLQVASDGTFRLPLAPEHFNAVGFLDGVDTVEELTAAARQPTHVRSG